LEMKLQTLESLTTPMLKRAKPGQADKLLQFLESL
jgi:hypothetical protein